MTLAAGNIYCGIVNFALNALSCVRMRLRTFLEASKAFLLAQQVNAHSLPRNIPNDSSLYLILVRLQKKLTHGIQI